LTELAEIHFIELEKLRSKKDIDKNSLLNEWLMFIENPESEEIEMIAKKIPEIKEAKKTLEILSLDKKARMTYEQRQKALKDKISMLSGAKEEGIKEGIEKGIKEGIKEGMKQEKIIIAKNLLDVLDDKTISMKTGLSIKEVNELRR
jgi:predicted transposase/invertase (TIGR01784 family)